MISNAPTKALNQAVKRNADRFPEDFMFRLTEEEWAHMRSQIVTTSPQQGDIHIQVLDGQSNIIKANSSQNVTSSQEHNTNRRSHFVTASPSEEKTSKRFRNKTLLPYAFTEHGVTMLASVLKSPKAVKMSIEVVRAFIALKQSAIEQNSIAIQFQEIRDRLGEHDVQLNAIYNAIENLLDEKAEQRQWEDRERIGFIAPLPSCSPSAPSAG